MKVAAWRIASFVQHALRDTMAPWIAMSLTLHAGLIAAILSDANDAHRLPAAGGVIAVEILVVEGPDMRAAAATGDAGDHAPKPDAARTAERRAATPAAPDRVTTPTRAPAPPNTADAATPAATGDGPQSSPLPFPDAAGTPPPPRRADAVAARRPPPTAAPVLLAPRPRPKPPPPAVEALRRSAATADAPAGATTQGLVSDSDGDGAELGAAPAFAGGSRGASPQPGNPKPVYPYGARRQGAQGRVVLRVEVLPDGAAGAVAVDRSSGNADLDAAAVAAVRQWRFRPALRGGTPVAARVQVPIRFRLQ